MRGSRPVTQWNMGYRRRLRSRRRTPRVDRSADTRRECDGRVAPDEPTKARCLPNRIEAQRIEQMRDRFNVTRRPLHANDIGFLPGLRRHQRSQERSAVTRAAFAELQTGEPKLVAAFERAEQAKADRRQAV